MREPRYPSLYQINTRVWLTELSRNLGRPATLDDIPDAELDRLAELGFDWIWFLSVWQTGPGAQQVSRNNPEWRREFQETLPDLREEDIAGSGFAITGYTVHQNLGGDAALARLRERLRTARPEAHARLRAQSHGARSSLDRRSSRLFHSGHRTRPGQRSAELHPGQTPGRRSDPRLRPRSVFLRLARHAATQLRQPRHARGDDRRTGEDRRTMRRRALRHGHAGPARRLRTNLGPACAALLADGDPARARARSRLPASWPKSTGTWNGRCSSRASTTPTTNDSTIASAKAMRGPCASIFTRASTTRTSWPVSWRTTTNRGQRRRSRRKFTRPRRSSRFCPPACVSSTKVSSRAERNGSRPTSSAARTNPSTSSCSSFTTGCLRSFVSPPFAMANGNCWNARRPGKEIGRTIASWLFPGKARTESDFSWS